jgi:hypothetical protein
VITSLLRNAASTLAFLAITVGVALLFVGTFGEIAYSTEPPDHFGQQPSLGLAGRLITFGGGTSSILVGAALLFGRSQIGDFHGSR